jgi:drug/metabolite transporter (DMT)-like permease
MTIKRVMGPEEWGLLLLLALLWGGSFFFVEIGLRAFGPMTLVAARVGLAAAVLLIFVWMTGHRMPRDAATWGTFLVMGLLNNFLPFGLITWGQLVIESGLAAILNATTPLFTVLLAHLLTRDERAGPARFLGVAIGFCGVVVLLGPEALKGLGARGWGQLAVLAAAVSYAFAGIFGRRLTRLPSPVAAAGMLTASTALALPTALYAEGLPEALPAPTVLLAVLGLALFSTAAAYLVYFRILARAGATNLLLVTFLIPPAALLLGALVLDEKVSGQALAGLVFILLGLAVVDGRPAQAVVRLCRRCRRPAAS